MAKTKKRSEGSIKVFRFLKEAGVGVGFSTKEVQQALGFEKPGSVTGSVTALVNKGHAVRFTETVTDAEGKEKEVKKFALTQEGADYDLDAELAAADSDEE